MKRILLIVILLTACASSQQFEIVDNYDRFQPDVHRLEPNEWLELHRKVIGPTLVFLTPQFIYNDDPTSGYFIFQINYLNPDWMFINKLLVLVGDEVIEFEPAVEPMREINEGYSTLLDQTIIREKVTFSVPESLIKQMIASEAVAMSLRSDDHKLDIDVPVETIEKLRLFHEHILRVRGG